MCLVKMIKLEYVRMDSEKEIGNAFSSSTQKPVISATRSPWSRGFVCRVKWNSILWVQEMNTKSGNIVFIKIEERWRCHSQQWGKPKKHSLTGNHEKLIFLSSVVVLASREISISRMKQDKEGKISRKV